LNWYTQTGGFNYLNLSQTAVDKTIALSSHDGSLELAYSQILEAILTTAKNFAGHNYCHAA
jgi:hypothetical protein